MSASYNKVILVGNLTRDPQVRYTPGGTAVTDIGLAVNDRYKDKQSGQWVERPTFVDITLWGRTAEVAGEYLSKGRSVLIEGRLQLDQWDDKQTGQKRSKLKVVGDNMQMLGGREGGGGGGGSRSGGGGGSNEFSQPAGTTYENNDGGGGGNDFPDDEVPF